MLSRSGGQALFAGLGAAAVIAAGAPAALAEPSPDPSGSPSPGESPTASPSPTPTPTPDAKLVLSAVPDADEAKPGERVALTIRVRAAEATATDVRVTGVTASAKAAKIGGECPAPFTAAGCVLGTLDADERDTVAAHVSLPKSLKKTTRLSVTVTVEAANAPQARERATITYTVPVRPPAKRPAPRPEPAPKPEAPVPSGGGRAATVAPPPYTPPAPNATFGTAPPTAKGGDVALPSIAAPQTSPASAARPGQNRLRGNQAPVAQDLEFERVAGTQAAWLAALLVAVSLLLTQLRIGRVRTARALAAAERARRTPGTHRRPRRGVYGKR